MKKLLMAFALVLNLSASSQAADPSPMNYRRLVDLQGLDLQCDPGTGEPLVSTAAGVKGHSDHPDDIFWDNSLSPSAIGTDGPISAVIVYQGQLFVGGRFDVVGNVIAHGLATWNGASWHSVSQDFTGHVNALAVYNEKLIAAGQFTLADGGPNCYIASWDGSSWMPLGGGGTSGIYDLTVYGDQLIAGGNFTSIDGIHVGNIAAWDGSAWSALGSGISGGTVEALAVYDGSLIAGGKFDTAGGATAWNIASWDGSVWSALDKGITSAWGTPVQSLTVYDGKLIAGGYFASASQIPNTRNIAAWDGTSWSPLGSGVWGDVYRRDVTALTIYDGKLIAAGDFTIAGDDPVHHIASWDGSSWAALGSGISGGTVEALAVLNGSLIAGGNFDTAGDVTASNIASWGGASWYAFGTGTSGSIDVVTVYDNKLIAGGRFTAIRGVAANRIAAWNGSSWEPLGSGVSGGVDQTRVTALAVYDGRLIAGGDFTTAGESSASRIASWDGSQWSPLGGGLSGGYYPTVNFLAVYDGQLIAGGAFDLADGDSAKNIASWDGTSWSPLGSRKLDFVSCLAVYDGKLYAGGLTDGSGAMLVSWDGSSWTQHALSDDYTTDDGVYALTVYDHKLIVGGYLHAAGGTTVRNVVAYDGASWVPLGDGLPGSPGWNGVNALLAYNGKLIAGGELSVAAGAPSATIAAWDGDSWQPLGSGTNRYYVSALGNYEGNLIVGGWFSVAGNKVSVNIAQWTKKTTVSIDFDIKPGSCPNPLNTMNRSGHGKAVLPTAILGTDDFDVHEIDPESITLNGVSPVRWSYEDVGTPIDRTEDSCACSEGGPDGYEDLTLKFDRKSIVSPLTFNTTSGQEATVAYAKRLPYSGNNVSDNANHSGAPLRDSYVLRVEGQLNDGTAFEGYDCVVLMTKGEPVATALNEAPRDLKLIGNHPNPFNPSTQIHFYLPEATNVKIDIYNVLGQRVTRLVDGVKEAGEHVVEWDGSRVASGIYFYRFEAGEYVATKKMLLIR